MIQSKYCRLCAISGLTEQIPIKRCKIQLAGILDINVTKKLGVNPVLKAMVMEKENVGQNINALFWCVMSENSADNARYNALICWDELAKN